MPFCPVFSAQCPRTYAGPTGCEMWAHFGCNLIDKPGIPAIWTDDDGEERDCFILSITMSNMPPPLDKPIIIHACDGQGTIRISDDLSRFRVHLLHNLNHKA